MQRSNMPWDAPKSESDQVSPPTPPPVMPKSRPPERDKYGVCKRAKNSLYIGIVSLFCFGILAGPIAIYEGIKAKQEIAIDGTLKGDNMATTGIILGSVGLSIWGMAMFIRILSLL